MDWANAYRAYDDGALEALTNAGLLRRAVKDVEAGKVQWGQEGANIGKVSSDGQNVELDARGPQHTRCNCPAPGICKHILAAVLWLRDQPAVAASEPLVASIHSAECAPPPATQALDPLRDVLALDSASFFKAAGLAATREAARALLGTPGIGIEWRVQGASLVMDLAELGVSCRWIAGAGFAGMLSEVAANQRKAVHLIALGALRIALAEPLVWPQEMIPQVRVQECALAASERAFLVQVRATLAELLDAGLAHVSTLVSARLLALNMSARGEGLPRLAALLRNLGGMLELLVRHDHQVRERDALALICTIEALCLAMQDAADTDTALLAGLRGRVRRSFDDAQTLELLPVGAHWWQTLGGARGLSLAFWSLPDGRLLQATLARPDATDTAFTRQSAWSSQSLWPGVGAAEQVCTRPLQLSQPRLAEDDRLALGGASRAQTLPVWQASDPRLSTLGCSDWAELAERLRGMIGLAGNIGESLLLRPANTGASVLHEAQQQLRWTLADAQGAALELVLPLGGQGPQGSQNSLRARNLERFVARKARVHTVLVRVEQSHAQTHLLPIAVLSTNDKDQLQLVSFDFAAEAPVSTPLTQRILRLLQARKLQAPSAPAPKLAERLLLPILDVLETQAATGRIALTQVQREQLSAAAAAIASVGLHSVSVALKAHIEAPNPQTLMRLQRLSLWLLELEGLPKT